MPRPHGPCSPCCTGYTMPRAVRSRPKFRPGGLRTRRIRSSRCRSRTLRRRPAGPRAPPVRQVRSRYGKYAAPCRSSGTAARKGRLRTLPGLPPRPHSQYPDWDHAPFRQPRKPLPAPQTGLAVPPGSSPRKAPKRYRKVSNHLPRETRPRHPEPARTHRTANPAMHPARHFPTPGCLQRPLSGHPKLPAFRLSRPHRQFRLYP